MRTFIFTFLLLLTIASNNLFSQHDENNSTFKYGVFIAGNYTVPIMGYMSPQSDIGPLDRSTEIWDGNVTLNESFGIRTNICLSKYFAISLLAGFTQMGGNLKVFETQRIEDEYEYQSRNIDASIYSFETGASLDIHNIPFKDLYLKLGMDINIPLKDYKTSNRLGEIIEFQMNTVYNLTLGIGYAFKISNYTIAPEFSYRYPLNYLHKSLYKTYDDGVKSYNTWTTDQYRLSISFLF